MPACFPYLPVSSGGGGSALVPLLPIDEFDVRFRRAQLNFEIELSRK